MTEIPVRHFPGRDGVRLAYRELGEGRPLILIHGYLGNAMTMVETGIAGRLGRRSGYRVIMPDLRGHGDSARPHDPAAYPPDVLADDGLALIEQPRAHRLRPGRLLAGRTHGHPAAGRGADPRPARIRGRAGAGGDYPHRRTRWSASAASSATSARSSPAPSEQAMEDWVTASGGDPVALAHVLGTFVDTPLAELARITVPTLVLTGSEDGHNDTAEALARRPGKRPVRHVAR